MKWIRPSAVVVALLVATIPIGAAVKAMNLKQTMEINDRAVHGLIVAKDIVVLDHPWAGTVYTRLTIEGTSLRTGEPVDTAVVFLGSHDPDDRFATSEMPELRDVRIGNEVIVFAATEASVGGRNLVHNLSGVYRIERGFGEPVVMGKGQGFAFPSNTRLSKARAEIESAHRLILSERATQPNGLGK